MANKLDAANKKSGKTFPPVADPKAKSKFKTPSQSGSKAMYGKPSAASPDTAKRQFGGLTKGVGGKGKVDAGNKRVVKPQTGTR